MKNEAIIIYRCGGIRIAYEPLKEYMFTIVEKDGRITTKKSYPIDFKSYLEDLHIGLEKPNPNLRPVMEFLQQTGNASTKELASQLLEQLF